MSTRQGFLLYIGLIFSLNIYYWENCNDNDNNVIVVMHFLERFKKRIVKEIDKQYNIQTSKEMKKKWEINQANNFFNSHPTACVNVAIISKLLDKDM